MSTPDEQPKLPSTSDLPTLVAARSQHGPNGSLVYGLKLLSDGLKAGAIANARYKDAYFVLTRVMEDAWKDAVISKFPFYGKNKAADEAHRKYPHSPTFLRWEKPRAEFARMRDTEADPLTRSIHEAAVRFYDECLPLAKVVVWARAHAVKRQPAPPPETPEEALPQATREGRRIVREVLAETLEGVRAEYREELLDQYVGIVKRLYSKRDEIDPKDAIEWGPPGLFSRTFEIVRQPGARKSKIRRRDDWQEAVAAYTESQVALTFRRFIEKNVEKLGAIIELKGNDIPKRKIIDASVRGNILVTRMTFTFVDGSSFEVMNQIVHQYSPLGRPFVRFPTTFHDVRLADGSKLATPSEALMKTVFVGAEAPADDNNPPAPGP
ncbi:hypothetical protein ACVIGB_000909 [Bradyrhizobium sp. USDA 4341]